MPSYAIHLAIAKEYLKNNKKPKEDCNEFIQGVIYPDTFKDKSITHYGNNSLETNLFKFLQKNDLNNSFTRGYFLHLLTDYLFYNQCIEYWSSELYNDYDVLNKKIIDKYHIIIPEIVKEYMKTNSNSELKILSWETVEEFIDMVSKLNIDIVAEDIRENPDKWTKFRSLEN